MSALFVAALVWRFLALCFIIVAIAWFAAGVREHVRSAMIETRNRPARETVRRRFALGEVTEAQYREILAVLDSN
jgi:uncharacterized membrane protein